MKTIHLIRHAKSSWGFPHLTDHERPLSLRGEKDTRIMANALYKSGFNHWPKIYCSTAQRARLTIQGLADNWPDKTTRPNDWQVNDHLYTFDSGEIWTFIKSLNQELDTVLLLGHNPALTDFTHEASGAGLVNLPTCGYVELQSSANDWHQLQADDLKLNAFLKPKMFKG